MWAGPERVVVEVRRSDRHACFWGRCLGWFSANLM
jgi:hypothetical protein